MTVRPIRVLQSSPEPRGQTRFVSQIADGAPEDLTVLYFDWKTALTGDYDVFHVHWPEYLVRGRSFLGTWRQRVKFVRLLRRLRRESIPLVRTLHNEVPHERGSWVESALLSACDKRTDLFISINAISEPPVDAPHTRILHGHYRDRFSAHPRGEVVVGRVLNFGLIRPYKGIDELLQMFAGSAHDHLSLRIVGKPVDADLGGAVADASAHNPRVSSLLAFVDDDELVREVSEAEIVVLPYREMHNSGTLLVALSLDKPVVVPRSPVNEAIRNEVGPEWMHIYDGAPSLEFIAAAIATHRSHVGKRPSMNDRDWSEVGRRHRDAYAGAIERLRVR